MDVSTQDYGGLQMGRLSKSMPPAERCNVLRDLFITLSPHEIRKLRRWTGQVDFRCDLLSKLPLEITQQILGYLPLCKYIHLRRVSKEWFRILSAPETVRHLMRFWYPGAEADFEVPDGLTASAVSSSRAEHIDAYLSGDPFSMMKQPWELGGRATTTNTAYASGYIAYIDNADNARCTHLESGSSQSLSSLNGEPFIHIAVSTSILVATTNAGICYVWTHDKYEKQTFPLASNNVKSVTVSGETVAILYNPSLEGNKEIQMTLWTLKNNNSVQCFVKLQGLPSKKASRYEMKVIIDANEKHLVLFEQQLEIRKSLNFYFTRFDIHGRLHSQGSLQVPNITGSTVVFESPITSDESGCATICCFSQPLKVHDSSSTYYRQLGRIQYEPKQNNMHLKKNGGLHCSSDYGPKTAFIWKKTVFLEDHHSLDIIGPSKDTGEYNAFICIDKEYHSSSAILFGDENFLVHVCESGFHAWCFNKGTKMRNEDVDYRTRRQDHLQERVKHTRSWGVRDLERTSKKENLDLEFTGNMVKYRDLQQNKHQL